MLYLVPVLLVLAAVAAAALFACSPVPAEGGEEWRSCGVDYRRLHAQWAAQGQARDWDSLREQVRRWHELAAPGCAPALTEQVARDLNAAVFRFAVPGDGAVAH